MFSRFLLNHAKKALECPYTGLRRILNRVSDKVYEIDVNGTSRQVFIEKLQPAYSVRDDVDLFQHQLRSTPALRTYIRKRVTFAH